MRRRKKLIIKIIIAIIIVAVIIGFTIYIWPKDPISTYNNTNSENSNEISIITTDQNHIDENDLSVVLPENISIISSNTTPNTPNNQSNTNTTTENQPTTDNTNNKTYTAYIDNSSNYLITLISNNEVTIILSEHSKELIPEGAPTQAGVEYKVSGIEEEIVMVDNFVVDGYKYPVLLLLSKSGKLYYIDLEEAYKTGEFKVSGSINNLPAIFTFYKVKVSTSQNTDGYKTAVLVDNNGSGYEFTLDMIGK